MTNKLNNPFKITELINAVNELDINKQDTLISGTNIKTINGSSVLGNGNLTVTADTNDCVHKTGDETIGGRKTYTESYVHKNFDLTKGTLPTSANWWSNEYTDKNGSGLNNRLACMEYSISTNGDAYTHLRTYKYASNNTDSATLSIVYPITGKPFATVPTPITTTSTDSTQIATTGWVNSIGNNVVHKTGNETIGGTKIFTNGMITQNIIPKGNITLGTSTNTWGMMVNFQDTTGKRIARIQPMAVTTTNNRVGMWVNNADNTIEKGIYIDSDGTTSAPTPSAGDNSTKIATTAFVKAQGYAVDSGLVHTTGDETIGGRKTFNNEIHFKNSVFVDAAAGIEGGEIEFAKAPNSSLTGNVKLDVYKNSMRIFGPASNGDIRNIVNADIEQNALFVPSSDKSSSAVSTVGINKNQNGYIKFGNGIIIQWGYSNQYGTSKTVTLPTPFTSTNYAVTTSRYASEWAEGVIMQTNNYKTTSFDFAANDPGVHWIAVGY